MMVRLLLIPTLAAALLAGAAKKNGAGQSENENVKISATVFTDKEVLQQMLGSDLGGFYIVVEVKIEPRGETPLDLQRDDFLLRTYKDGDKAKPFAPSQIAGKGALVVSETGSGGAVMGDNRGPIWGGYPGSDSRPRRMGGDGGAIGNAGSTSSQATVQSGSKEKDNPVLAVLQERLLPEKKTDRPVSGLLYFPIEAKQKLKDLELVYSAPAGKVILTFR